MRRHNPLKYLSLHLVPYLVPYLVLGLLTACAPHGETPQAVSATSTADPSRRAVARVTGYTLRALHGNGFGNSDAFVRKYGP